MLQAPANEAVANVEQIVPEEQQAGMMSSTLKARILSTSKHMSCICLTCLVVTGASCR